MAPDEPARLFRMPVESPSSPLGWLSTVHRYRCERRMSLMRLNKSEPSVAGERPFPQESAFSTWSGYCAGGPAFLFLFRLHRSVRLVALPRFRLTERVFIRIHVGRARPVFRPVGLPAFLQSATDPTVRLPGRLKNR